MEYDIVILSDLHLSEGINTPSEDFFYDEEFKDLLNELSNRKNMIKLIFAGDTFDFLKPTPKEALNKFRNISKAEKKFGLNPSPQKACLRLERIINGHKLFFESLLLFTDKGNKVYILPGNHDIELFWGEVKQRFYDILEEKFNAIEKNRNNIEFLDWFYHDKEVFVLHGNQYDEVDSFKYFLNPVIPELIKQEELIDMPFGSFFVKYYFNKINPKAHDMKPSIKYLHWAIKKKPRTLLKLFWMYWPFLVRAWKKSRKNLKLDYCAAEKKHCEKLNELSEKFGIEYSVLKQIDSLSEEPLMNSSNFIKSMFKTHVEENFDQKLVNVAGKIKDLLNVKFVVFGHSHFPMKANLGDGYYLNTGTWTPTEYGKNVDYKKARSLPYVIISEGKAELLEWKI